MTSGARLIGFAGWFGLGLASAAAMGGLNPDVDMTLLNGGVYDAETGSHLAGVRVRLEDGWKTYWRHPGDAGVPPSFDFSASDNVADVEVKWPAPTISHDGFGWVVGYEDEVIFPVIITPQDRSQPITVSLDLDYAICADICIPLNDEEELALDDVGADRSAILRHLERTPAQANNRIRNVGFVETDGGTVLELTVDFGASVDEPRLLVEMPGNGKAGLLSIPDMISRTADGAATFRLPLEDLPENGQADVDITVIGLSPAGPFEQRVGLP